MGDLFQPCVQESILPRERWNAAYGPLYDSVGDRDGTCCLAETPSHHYCCTRAANHDGPHVGHWSPTHVCAVWYDEGDWEEEEERD